MEFSELIEKRRSVRGYAPAGIDAETINGILRSAQQAPSWKNWQGARCYAVLSPEILQQARLALPDFNQRSSDNAVLVITTFVKDLAGFTDGEPDNELGNMWGAYDLGLHDAYLVLAAKDAGYDSLIMGLRDSDKLRELLQIPENEVVMSVIAIGKGAVEGRNRKRKKQEEVSKLF